MSLDNVSTYARFSKNRGGTTGKRGNFILNSDGDFILQSKGGIPRITQSPEFGDFILQSPYTCFANMLNSDGDFILQSGGTDKIQITGHCTAQIMESGGRIRATP